MTFRERVYRAIQFQETDIVPYAVTFTAGARRKLAEYYGDPDFEGKIGNHLAWFSHSGYAKWTEVKPGHYCDEWGAIWNRTVDKDIGVVENRACP